MKRLTTRNMEYGSTSYICQTGEAAQRLSEIEDILGDDYNLDRLRELVAADREGRCVVFKFGIGSTVYRTWENPYSGSAYITEHGMYGLKNMVEAESWGNAYSTRESAEALLKGEQDG